MKTRNGFVSNSSTTSFCIMGVHVGYHQFQSQREEWEEVYENTRRLESAVPLQIFVGLESECAYLGLLPEEMKEGETLAHFRHRATSAIEKAVRANLIPQVDVKNVKWHYGEIDT